MDLETSCIKSSYESQVVRLLKVENGAQEVILKPTDSRPIFLKIHFC